MTTRTDRTWRLRAWAALAVVVVAAVPAWGAIFTDIAGLPAQRAIERLAAKGIFAISGDGRFNPGVTVTRGDVAVLLTRALGLSGQGVPMPEYKDLAGIPTEIQPAIAAVAHLATVSPQKAEVRKGQLLYSLFADKAVYGPTEIVIFRLTVGNTGKDDVKLEFASNQHFDYYIRDGEGNEVARWSYGRSFLPKPEVVTIAAGKTLPYDPALWQQLDQNDTPVPPGRYELVAVQNTKTDPTILSLVFNKGVMQAYPDNTFRPKVEVTRADLAAAVVRAMGVAESTAAPPVVDAAEIPPPLRGAVAAAIEKSIVAAYPDRTFRPARPATRADLAAALDVLMDTLNRYGFLKGVLKDPVAGNPPQIAIEDEKKAFRVYRVARAYAVYRNNRPADLRDLKPGDALQFLNRGEVSDVVYIEASGP